MKAKIFISLMISLILVTLSMFTPLFFIFSLPRRFYFPPNIDLRAYLIDILVWGGVTLISAGVFDWGIVWVKRIVAGFLMAVPVFLLLSFVMRGVNTGLLFGASFVGSCFLSTVMIQPKETS